MLLFISESKVPCNVATRWLPALNMYGVLGVNPNGTKEGLFLFWNHNVNVVLRSYSSSHIDVGVVWENLSWRFTGCYAPPTPVDKKFFWDLLIKLHKLRKEPNEKWLIGGDFNETMFDSEKMGGNKKNAYLTSLFFSCCNQINVCNVRTLGPKYTWSNKRKGSTNILQKLDQFLSDPFWRNTFPRAISTNCGFYGSDHIAVKLVLNHQIWVRKKNL